MAGVKTKFMKELTRLNKYIASMTGYSRREADKLIEEGKVSVNGKRVKEQGVKIDETEDVVFINNEPIYESKPDVFKFYKPRRVLTAYGEGRGKDTLEKFPIFAGRKFPYSGRLDYESEGLLIFSNDGELIQRMQKPEYKMEKEYLVTVDRLLSSVEMEEFASGLDTPKGKYQPCNIKFAGKYNYKVIIKEGKKRQIRNMFGYFGSKVKRLERVRIGPILIGNLKPGEYEMLSRDEIIKLYKATGLNYNTK